MHTLTLYAKTEDKNFLKCVALASAEMEGGPEEIGTKQTQTLGSHSLLGRWYRGAMGMNSRCQPRMLKVWTAWTTLQLLQWKEVQGNKMECWRFLYPPSIWQLIEVCVCVYVCMYTCICVCIYTYMCVYIIYKHIHVSNLCGLFWWLSDKDSVCQCRRCKFDSWVWKKSWRSKWQPTPVF